ncbi:hypothetical protein QKW35_05585 [Pontibacterium granulatum]|uniref:hypothetical protein n=1 Tax=Pontibacterium granulatum TaxID=2036029 RepID=UPI00249A8FFA|nr:hypothetical protein [Pontibacterium granulatum]MDI3323839.1 hypothetical protein [Pontibacterium granulatum]
MLYVLFFLALTFGLISARVHTIAARGGYFHPGFGSLAFKGMAMVSAFAVIVWGFINFDWYVPIVAFIAASILNGAVVTAGNWDKHFSVVAGHDLVATVLCISLYVVTYAL